MAAPVTTDSVHNASTTSIPVPSHGGRKYNSHTRSWAPDGRHSASFFVLFRHLSTIPEPHKRHPRGRTRVGRSSTDAETSRVGGFPPANDGPLERRLATREEASWASMLKTRPWGRTAMWAMQSDRICEYLNAPQLTTINGMIRLQWDYFVKMTI